ncbi:MAG: excinuclease ABC subunit UvrA [Clostridiales Family XIII bacterium]|uniref:UvrABC system protein A n=1 Tax=Hominibacterium faecale TaxID=2839743 RepID=A0A9J6QZ33_9FIRM|nr:excinuclease ABC subunit UvrA [Hominibacterium faecale]MCC2864375.1 excinuclease ABC subunit UvrA [Anaerovorax odorimutans]MCI7302511.1 excinuclease ABC subunit UvrA [Clostridia bacterium]MDE8733711.1 excinuclease ABC subunit UvrA [Eubacteriales bacterium DFI.9.88]MDY3011393.1 excinuclease ABC subunit UvrA [Clostridiales Family XIII bacterium]MCU7380795.1 excinuclease ABC subunit UvrA [Hominibacterium faecale]
MTKDIHIKGANENNLKNIDVTIPRDQMVVLTGLSGSGKSSLAFDTIYAEGQRRYVESLSSYARQFLGQMEKPNVEYIEGLSPAISIDQKTTSKNPRSTVGTVTEIYDYLRLMYARIGVPHCPVCGKEISSQSVDQIVDSLMELGEKTRITMLAPVVRQRKGEHEKILERIRKEGFTRVRVDGEIRQINEEEIKLEKNLKHIIEIVIDRIIVKEGAESRLSEACELAISHGDGLIVAHIKQDEAEYDRIFSTSLACPEHGVSIAELEPRMFSFNNPFGACPDCKGLGFIQRIDPDLIIAQQDKSIPDGCLSTIFASMEFSGFYRQMIEALAEYHKVDINTPYNKLPKKFKQELLYGTGKRHLKYYYTSRSNGTKSYRDHPFEGVINNLERRYRETNSEFIKEKMSKYMTITPCDTCGGRRLRPEVLAVTVGGKNIMEFCEMSIRDAYQFVESLHLSEKELMIANQVLKEIKARLNFLIDVGLDYLTLSRASATLSGGESQRIRLATQIGSSLVGVLYILDEPSIGLHQKDNEKLLATLRHLTDIGNTLIVVEHDEDTMYAADHIVDIGPGAGIHGGELVAEGTVEDIKKNKRSITGQYLSGEKKIEVPKNRRQGNGLKIQIKGAAENNLKKINVNIPLGKLVCVTGVSGSGKSSLVNEILYKGVAGETNGLKAKAGAHKKIIGIENIDKVIDINQSPIGRTPRSNPATYTGVFTPIRDLFAQLPEAKLRGYEKGRFSFNVKGGRCEACSGDGIIKIEMHFLPDVYVPCEVCKGRRYNRETLEVKYKGKSIFDVLDMNVTEALEFFQHIPAIARQLETLEQVGLGYIKLGQPSTQLSGGEAQRIKLASELSKRSTGKTLYILDEPTTGLHFADVDKLLQVLDTLVDAGNTVVVIEHNLDVIKRADHIIDLGPDGGFRGGEIVAEGTPEEVAQAAQSYTGQFLKKML